MFMFMLRYITYYVLFLFCFITCYLMLCFVYFMLPYNMLRYVYGSYITFYATLYKMLCYVI